MTFEVGERNVRAKYTPEQVEMFRDLYASGHTLHEIKDIFGMEQHTGIWSIVNYRTWPHKK